jgi:crotonobetainyl-CoA:carnitine CoA-transferase CaiB-like acyl-CoA transferase
LEWLNDKRLNSNNDRIAERNWFLPEVENLLKTYSKEEIIKKCEKADIPFAPVARPEDLFSDIQLNEGNYLLDTTLPDGTSTKLPKIPLIYGDTSFDLLRNPPAIGEHNEEILSKL